MTYLVLVRHGETVWHAEDRDAGVSDIALTTRGLEQAAQHVVGVTTDPTMFHKTPLPHAQSTLDHPASEYTYTRPGDRDERAPAAVITAGSRKGRSVPFSQ